MNRGRELMEALPARLRSHLRWLQGMLAAEDVRGFLVGGAVRDVLLQYPIGDVDVVLEADAIQFAESLSSSKDVQVKAHQAFRTATLVFADGTHLDLVTARSERYPRPGVLPVIEPATIRQDLARRDFGINTLAMPLNEEGFGEVLDLQRGLADLDQKKIRILHARGFIDDPTRLFRALRYAARYGFVLEENTAHWFHDAVVADAIGTVSSARIEHEFRRIFAEPRRGEMLLALESHGVLENLVPGWRLSVSDLGRVSRTEMVATHCNALGLECNEVELCWMALLVAWEAEDIDKLQQRLVLRGQTLQRCADLRHLVAQTQVWSAMVKPSTVYRCCESRDPMAVAFACWGFTEQQDALRHYLEVSRHVIPWVNGNHLRQLGIPPGPDYAVILEELFNAQLDGELQSPEDATRRLRERMACQNRH